MRQQREPVRVAPGLRRFGRRAPARLTLGGLASGRLAVGGVAIGIVVVLSAVGLAWQSSKGPGTAVQTEAAAGLSVPPPLQPRVELPLGIVPPGAVDAVNATAEVGTTTSSDPGPAGSAGTAAPSSEAPAPPAAAAKPARKAAAGAGVAPHEVAGRSASTAPFFGLGTWVDVFDWAPSYAKGMPVKLAPSSVDAMADQGVQVLYIQTTRADNPGAGDIVDPPVLQQWLARAQARGMDVVAWYLPTLTDVGADVRRLRATAGLASVDGIGVDIESKAVADDAERSRRLVDLSRQTRAALAGRPLSAITLPNVVTDVINTGYWPGFPWAEIRQLYDVWQPMAYWTNRTAASPYRNAERYTRENIDRMRAKLGDPNAVVHPVGGIGDQTTAADIQGYLKAVRDTRSVGASLYDWNTQSTASYAAMRAARS